MAQYKDADEFWILQHIHGTGIKFQVDGGTGADINISGGEITDTNEHHIAICKSGSDVGIYKDGVQVAYGSAACTTALAAALTLGGKGAADYFDGYLGHWRVQASNIFNASPNVGLTDTITVPTAPYSYEAPSTSRRLRCLMGVGD